MEYLHGGDIYTNKGMIDFSVNVNPYGPSKAVLRAAKLAMARIGEYPDPECRELRAHLAAQMGVKPEHLVFGNGAAELIFALVQAEKPKKAVISTPSFAEYERALRAADCRIQYYNCREENGFVMQEDFMNLLTEDVDMVFLCSPDNPAGTVIPKILMRKIMIRCEFLRIRLVLDQSFFEFLAEDEDDLFLTYKDDLHESTKKYPSLFLLRAFTKMYAMPGLRLGYGICQDERLIEKLEECRQPWSVSIPAQEAGLAAIKDQKRVRNIRGFLLRERRWLERELDALRIEYFPSKANYILLKSDLDLYELLKEYGILIRDCSNYRGLRKGFYRIAVRQRGDNQKLIDALQEIYEAAQAEQILREMEEQERRERARGERKRDDSLEVKFYDEVQDELLKFAVVAARFEGKWVFCRHKERETYELPGGHRESEEAILDAARRELREETGAVDFTVCPVCVYSVIGKNEVNKSGEESYGMLYFAEISKLDSELHYEMEEIVLAEELPENLTYPSIQSELWKELGRRNYR